MEGVYMSSTDKSIEHLADGSKGSINDLSDIDLEKIQYSSSTLKAMKDDGYYERLLIAISAMAYSNKSKAFMIARLKEKFPYYCKGLTQVTFNKWLKFYPDIAEAYTFNRDEAYGELIYLGMEKSRRSTKVARDDFIVKFMDKLDEEKVVLTNPNEGDTPSFSKQSMSTINRIIEESRRFGGLDKVEIDDSEVDDNGED